MIGVEDSLMQRVMSRLPEVSGRWDEEILKGEIPYVDTEAVYPGIINGPLLSGESNSNQEELSSMPGEGSDENRKRLRDNLESDSLENDFSEPARKELGRRQSSRHCHSPRDRSSDSGGDSRELRNTKQRKSYAEHSEKPDPVVAAKNKASRERQRRERLNDSFIELTRTLDPDKSIKAEKTVIIADTIKVINNIRSENDQLVQEKRRLKAQVAKMENEKQELLFQQSFLKHELEAAQASQAAVAAAAHATPYPGGQSHHRLHQFSGPVVAVGVPVNGSSSTGRLSQLLQHDDASLQPPIALQQQQTNAVLQQQHLVGQPEGLSDAFLTSSLPGFSDLDIKLEEVLEAFHPGGLMSVSPPVWPTSST